MTRHTFVLSSSFAAYALRTLRVLRLRLIKRRDIFFSLFYAVRDLKDNIPS